GQTTDFSAAGREAGSAHEDLSQCKVFGFRPDRLHRGDPVSLVQVGPESHTAYKRGRTQNATNHSWGWLNPGTHPVKRAPLALPAAPLASILQFRSSSSAALPA